jgi:Questin oxidase-like
MAATTYDDAVSAALERLRGVGYEWGPSFVNHAPMAAEALARLGYTDDVPGWVEHNIRMRHYYDPPEPRSELTSVSEQWEPALGDFSRVADWTELFERELAADPWTTVLTRWWPRLLPGMAAALTHGIIRTAHAVRALALAAGDTTLQRRELAHGLGYWAARYWEPAGAGYTGSTATARHEVPGDSTAALRALNGLVLDYSGRYAATPKQYPVPLIHSITAPAAVRLVCDHLPPEQHAVSYETARRCCVFISGQFGAADYGAATFAGKQSGDSEAHAGPADPEQIVSAAVELGDEHAIKLAEVATRYYRADPDERYLAASRAATIQIARSAR